MKILVPSVLLMALLSQHSFAQKAKPKPHAQVSACGKCTVPDAYSEKDSEKEIAATDLSVEQLEVKDEGTFVSASITILNRFDDTAHEVELIVTLPVNVKDISASVGSHDISFKRCGARYKFCIGTLDKNKPLTITIKTSKCLAANYAGWESFGAFVSASTPDPCPINNYKGWANTNTANSNLCKEYIPNIIKTGF